MTTLQFLIGFTLTVSASFAQGQETQMDTLVDLNSYRLARRLAKFRGTYRAFEVNSSRDDLATVSVETGTLIFRHLRGKFVNDRISVPLEFFNKGPIVSQSDSAIITTEYILTDTLIEVKVVKVSHGGFTRSSETISVDFSSSPIVHQHLRNFERRRFGIMGPWVPKEDYTSTRNTLNIKIPFFKTLPVPMPAQQLRQIADSRHEVYRVTNNEVTTAAEFDTAMAIGDYEIVTESRKARSENLGPLASATILQFPARNCAVDLVAPTD